MPHNYKAIDYSEVSQSEGQAECDMVVPHFGYRVMKAVFQQKCWHWRRTTDKTEKKWTTECEVHHSNRPTTNKELRDSIVAINNLTNRMLELF